MTRSEPNLLEVVRRATSDISSSAGASSRGGGGYNRRKTAGGASGISASEASFRSRSSGRRAGSSRYEDSMCSSRYSTGSQRGMTLQDMQNAVQNSAMDRYLENLQKDAQETVKANDYWSTKMQENKNEERDEVHRKRSQAAVNQQLLRQQIEDNKMRRAEDRREVIEAASAHSFPLFTETFISLDEVNAYRDNQKKIFRQELTDQLACINTMKNMRKKEDLEHALSKNSLNIGEMGRARAAERHRLQQQGRDMVASWDRDIRLTNIKKAISGGKDMVKETLRPGQL
eukprot:TRINITY_DN51759_c0_g1_i1.p1 TRINITY_DN51759_c0_g1~~TRINITY_DN51759_c0_g1_i1.p1  ORF type:complete len:287 (-),score=53.29 TRINITY_DN51759_c0_g1_i1:85-945(-)